MVERNQGGEKLELQWGRAGAGCKPGPKRRSRRKKSHSRRRNNHRAEIIRVRDGPASADPRKRGRAPIPSSPKDLTRAYSIKGLANLVKERMRDQLLAYEPGHGIWVEGWDAYILTFMFHHIGGSKAS